MNNVNHEPPRGLEMTDLLRQTKERLMREIEPRRSSKSRRRIRIIGASAVAIIASGGVTAAASTGVFGGAEATRTTSSTINLGRSPADANLLTVTYKIVCTEAGTYSFVLDHGGGSATFTCNESGPPKHYTDSVDFAIAERVSKHVLTVTTNQGTEYTVKAEYGRGQTERQKLEEQAAQMEQQRQKALENSATPSWP